ncbi:vWA domain-containing protein [uncultured Gimesia sp.]|uniref:vWA domain-containing protein n=1 Tax=uncultured Gimesia sp. TaxID=1678688 RepID=UPI0030D85B66|tara:strand:+ start:76088 stop:77065 length:978 start_codon:yes stop_codon:yes gene_type:complete
MPTCQQDSDPPSRWNQGIGVSTLFHLILIGGLAMIVDHEVELPPTSAANTIQTSWSAPQKDIEPVILEITAVTQNKESASSAAVISKLPPVLDLNSAPDPKSLSSFLDGPLPQATQHEESLTTKYAADIVGALLTSSAFGNANSGSGNGAGNGDFFGLSPKSKRIVYVVDSSKSMNFPHESVGKTRLGRVKLELAKSIFSMDENQEFFVIFFSDFAIPMPARKLQPATPAAKQKFLSWVAKVPGVGTTEPLEALLLALRLQPDTIYFLTDGQFNPTIVRAFNKVAAKTKRNQNVIVNGICLGNREGESLIRELAENNSGSYTFIP